MTVLARGHPNCFLKYSAQRWSLSLVSRICSVCIAYTSIDRSSLPVRVTHEHKQSDSYLKQFLRPFLWNLNPVVLTVLLEAYRYVTLYVSLYLIQFFVVWKLMLLDRYFQGFRGTECLWRETDSESQTRFGAKCIACLVWPHCCLTWFLTRLIVFAQRIRTTASDRCYPTNPVGGLRRRPVNSR